MGSLNSSTFLLGGFVNNIERITWKIVIFLAVVVLLIDIFYWRV